MGVLGRAPAPAAAVAVRRPDRLGAAHGGAVRDGAGGLHARAGRARAPGSGAEVRDADRLAPARAGRAVRARLPRGGGGAAALARRARTRCCAGCACSTSRASCSTTPTRWSWPPSRPGCRWTSWRRGPPRPRSRTALRADMRARRARRRRPRARRTTSSAARRTERRYTCPSYELIRSTPPPADWPTAARVDLPGFRPVEAYEAAIANLAPELTRRPDPASVREVLEWAGMPLATVEVAAVCDREVADVRGELARGARLRSRSAATATGPRLSRHSGSCASFARSDARRSSLSLALARRPAGLGRLKLAAGPAARAALATYGIRDEPLAGHRCGPRWARSRPGWRSCVAAGAPARHVRGRRRCSPSSRPRRRAR